MPTDNAEAYDLYLQAIKERSKWRGSATFKAMKPLLDRDVALDPNFLRAQVLLAETYGRLLWTGEDPDRIYGAKTLELVTDIRRRWPDRIEGHLALGHYYYTVERDYTRALAEHQAVEEVFPNDMEVLNSLGASLKRLGRFEEYLRYMRRLVVLDPENALVAWNLIEALIGNGLLEEALVAADEGVKKFPEDYLWPLNHAWYRLFLLGDVKGFLSLGERLRKEGRWAQAGSDLTWLLYGQGYVKTALEHAAARMSGKYGWNDMFAETDRAMILRVEGQDDEAQAAAEHALDFVRLWIETERPFPNTNTRSWYTLAAYCAAIAGDLEAVTKYRASSFAAPVDEYVIEDETLLTNVQIDALLGDAAAGWTRIVSLLGTHYPLLITAEYAVTWSTYLIQPS